MLRFFTCGINRICVSQAGEKDAKLWVNPLKKLSFLLIKHGERRRVCPLMHIACKL